MKFTSLVILTSTYINDSYTLAKKNILNNKSVPSDGKSYHEFCTFFWVKTINNSPNKGNN